MDPLAHHVCLVDRVQNEGDEFDIIHSHIDYLPFPLFRRLEAPWLTTLHGRLDLPDLVPVYRRFDDVPLVSISNHQRRPLSWANWQATVYHGLPESLYRFHREPGEYLAFLGRISPEKRVDEAIEIAQRVGMPIRIAAKVDAVDRDYFEAVVKPLLARPNVEFIGEIGEGEKDEFLGNALALLFPINWPEPFGLVMIEAMACGTPVVAYRHGSVPEVMDEGVTGFIVQGTVEAVRAVRDVPRLNRKRCREMFEDRFTAKRMARDYLGVYRRLMMLRTDPSALEYVPS
jgi:glycosyltransferase involved in cell wall biosynthesis